MSFITFESGTEKERIRNEIREAREELLKRAQKNAERQAEREVSRKLRGEDDWMHPMVEKKIKKISKKPKKKKKSEKGKKEKKRKKEKKEKHKKREKHESTDSSSSSTEDEIPKKTRKKHSSPDNSDSISESSGEVEEWVEKKTNSTSEKANIARDDWMTGSLMLPTYSKIKNTEIKKQNIDSYNPAESSRELNPYWKDGGSGLPAFRKPSDDNAGNLYVSKNQAPRGNWRKHKEIIKVDTSHEKDINKYYKESTSKHPNEEYSKEIESDSPSSENEDEGNTSKPKESSRKFLTDQEMNKLGAEIVKAEILGDMDRVNELKTKLESAKCLRNQIKIDAIKMRENANTKPRHYKRNNNDEEGEEHILLTTTDDRGVSRPLPRQTRPIDPYGGKKKNKRTAMKVETHADGERQRYFADDDRYDLKQMFEREKYTTGSSSDAQFVEMMGKQKHRNDDLDDIFADNIRKDNTEYDESRKETQKAVQQHEDLMKILDSCDKCFDSSKMEKQLIVSIGSYVYLALPWHEGLQKNHCLIIPMQHVSSSTQLDENVWNEIICFRKALCRLFESISEEVIFFETANSLHKKPHMIIHCVPSKNFDMAQFYFKKAIQESEQEWSTNKQLVMLKDKDLRRSIPKGLPYFWVNFGMETGFAHVIEDQRRFPSNFAQEIIGGILELDPRLWRKPRKEYNSIAKVKQFADLWKKFDCTT